MKRFFLLPFLLVLTSCSKGAVISSVYGEDIIGLYGHYSEIKDDDPEAFRKSLEMTSVIDREKSSKE